MGIEEKLDRIMAYQDRIMQKLDTPPALVNPELEELPLTTTQAAQLLNLREQSIINYIRAGKLAGGRNGKSFYTSYAAIKEFRKQRFDLQGRTNDNSLSNAGTQLNAKGERATTAIS